MTDCPFCGLLHEGSNRIIESNEYGFVMRDGYPVSEGHTLIISKRHVGSFFELDAQEQSSLLALLNQQKTILDNQSAPLGYNVGINDGQAAGQTVPHLHIHLIPRYQGDIADPRGGVRWVIPEKAVYWSGE